MTKTFTNLANVLAAQSLHVMTLGRKSRHEIPDLMDKGWTMMEKGEESNDDGEMGDGCESSRAELDNILTELVG